MREPLAPASIILLDDEVLLSCEYCGAIDAGRLRARHRVVVGVDGSPESVKALRRGAQEAVRRDAVLVVVHACQLPPVYPWLTSTPVPLCALQDTGHAILDQAVREVEQMPAPPPRVEHHLRYGAPWRALVDEASRADLLVVGHSHRGWLRRILGRSVSRRCARLARCPVVVLER